MNYKLEKIGLLRKYKPIYSSGDKITVGSSVKLVFRLLESSAEVHAERLWVNVTAINKKTGEITGYIDNDPIYVDLKYHDEIAFSMRNVLDIDNS